MSKTNSIRPLLVTALVFFCCSSAHAISSFSVSSLSSVSQDMVNELIQTVAVGTAHRAYMPASPMGWAIGLDVGVEATAVRLPSDFRSAISTTSGQSLDNIPTLVPVPKFNVHKGLPFAIDVGMSYIGYQDKLKLIGGDIKWSFLDLVKIAPISAALRFSGTSEKLWYLNATTWQVDLLASKSFFFIEPYVGTGLQFWSGSIDVPTGLPASSGLPTNVSASASGTNVHFFGGVPFKLGLFWFTAEADYSTAAVSSFGAKFSLNF